MCEGKDGEQAGIFEDGRSKAQPGKSRRGTATRYPTERGQFQALAWHGSAKQCRAGHGITSDVNGITSHFGSDKNREQA